MGENARHLLFFMYVSLFLLLLLMRYYSGYAVFVNRDNFIEIDKWRIGYGLCKNCGQMETGQTSRTYKPTLDCASAIAPYLTVFALTTKSIALNHMDFQSIEIPLILFCTCDYRLILYSNHSKSFHFDVSYLSVTVFGQVKRLFSVATKVVRHQKKMQILLKSVRFFIVVVAIHVRMVSVFTVCIAMDHGGFCSFRHMLFALDIGSFVKQNVMCVAKWFLTTSCEVWRMLMIL